MVGNSFGMEGSESRRQLFVFRRLLGVFTERRCSSSQPYSAQTVRVFLVACDDEKRPVALLKLSLRVLVIVCRSGKNVPDKTRKGASSDPEIAGFFYGTKKRLGLLLRTM
jgi:hypothetical protein